MAVIPYPSIDRGFLYDPGDKLDCILSDFFESENAQSYLFRGSIFSLPFILQQTPDNPDEVTNRIERDLRALLLKYFDDCFVETGIIPSESQTKFDIKMVLNVTQEGSTISLRGLLNINGSKLEASRLSRE